MGNCRNCSAPLPPDSIECHYCGSRNDVDLKGVHHYTTHETDSLRMCPRCSIGLTTVDLKTNGCFLIERCEQCLGLFFDPGELEALLEATVENVYDIDRARLAQNISTIRSAVDRAYYIKCPVCSKIMNRVNFGAKSGVVVDRCKQHGAWLDGGELRQLLEWMKAGGKLLDLERREQAKKMEEHEQVLQRKRGEGKLEISSEETFELFGRSVGDQDPDLFQMIKRAMRLFLQALLTLL